MNFQKVWPPAWFLLSIMSMIGLHLCLPVKQLLFPPLNYLGMVASAMGIGMALPLPFGRSPLYGKINLLDYQ